MATTARIVPVNQQGRTIRRPQHTWAIKSKPWQIQPICIAPVLPGETMRNLLFQSRVVSKPLKNPLIGWHCEYYWFYIKHRDLTDRDLFVSMVLDSTTSLTSLHLAANPKYYHYANSVPWVKLCLDRVVEEFFRDEGEAITVATIDGVPIASINQESWLHSAILSSDLTAIDINLSDAGSPGGAAVGAREIDAAMRQWEFLRANNLTTMDYEQFLATYGVRPTREDLHIPELLRFVRQWQYPSNTVEPTTGAPSSALSWAIAERADKDRFFREPGFIFGVSVVRPKVYRRQQDGSAIGIMDNAFAWLPAILADDPATSLRLVTGGTGPLKTLLPATDYVVDVKDLLVYGDQFLNFDPGVGAGADVTDNSLIDLPGAALSTAKRYASSADADALFAAASPANIIWQDGVASLAIASMQQDTTPSSGMRML